MLFEVDACGAVDYDWMATGMATPQQRSCQAQTLMDGVYTFHLLYWNTELECPGRGPSLGPYVPYRNDELRFAC